MRLLHLSISVYREIVPFLLSVSFINFVSLSPPVCLDLSVYLSVSWSLSDSLSFCFPLSLSSNLFLFPYPWVLIFIAGSVCPSLVCMSARARERVRSHKLFIFSTYIFKNLIPLYVCVSVLLHACLPACLLSVCLSVCLSLSLSLSLSLDVLDNNPIPYLIFFQSPYAILSPCSLLSQCNLQRSSSNMTEL